MRNTTNDILADIVTVYINAIFDIHGNIFGYTFLANVIAVICVNKFHAPILAEVTAGFIGVVVFHGVRLYCAVGDIKVIR